jgi:hypothetical protein
MSVLDGEIIVLTLPSLQFQYQAYRFHAPDSKQSTVAASLWEF